ncbi:MAG: respiratory nitrate reductase subunit beta [Kiritimatiellia bacterium]|jgi:ethylbenzene hydroxylase subunit beta/complex iron-sulfur molybdoenzyme family reductase subunit beta|nr:respiratory nitrate reductase subunit beta [Pseudomonadales bacterium]MDP6469401.1 respiratory nitrate reductase subunit beta [Pseudomonadales bacterium]MDP6828980.1 respiratory nitrate reductase subunit beta [Pseudomonadales bacterium]MDP7024686.1 respiratory nitrate reductase subunit beta [Kiritimatiellia bacterium]|tara:strand:+ start:1885 stop:2916 length:1032 start_codon:yes stop_codon:yes gene_type:complete
MSDSASNGQIAWVIDLNKCIGCQTCSVACKVLWTREDSEKTQWWCSVNTLPGRGYPRDWESMGGGYNNGELVLGTRPADADFGGGFEYNHEAVFYGGSGGEAHLEPQAPRDGRWTMNWDEDEGAGDWPNAYYFYMPRLCNHCSRPACAEACPSGALKKNEDGLVLRDESVCAGNGTCMEACPYKKIHFNHERNIGQHCIGCYPRIEAGVAPACVRQCPGRAMFIGRLGEEGSAVNRLVHEWGIALPLHPEYGTHPNVYYVPPLSPPPLNEDGSVNAGGERIPSDYLETLFGEDVHGALDKLKTEMETVRGGGSSEMLKTLIAYKWQELLGPFAQDPARIIATG